MDTVVLDGVQYVKASVAAKSFKYTSDYVGQLCRGKKIDARLVGRTWFVNIDSIREHRRGKYKTQKEAAKQLSEEKSHIPTSDQPAVKVAAPLASSTAKQLNLGEGDKHKQKKLHVFYELDDELLFPKITKKKTPPARQIVIKQVDAQKLKIKSREKQTGFTPTSLPEVSLSGKLKITSYKSVSVDEEEPAKTTATSPVKSTPVAVRPATRTEQKKVVEPVRKVQVNKIKSVALKNPTPTPTPTQNVSRANKKPADLKVSPIAGQSKKAANKNHPSEKDKPASPRLKNFVRFSPAIATVCAIACVGFIFSASSLIVSSQSVQDSQLVLQVANLLEIFSQNTFGAK